MTKRLQTIEPKWLLIIVFFVSGVFLGGIGLYIWYGVSEKSISTLRLSQSSQYSYISPLLGVETQGNKVSFSNRSLELKIQGLVSEQKKNGDVIDAGVYFRDLKSGYWTGVNEDLEFSPGRILKVPLLIAYYKLAEEDPSILQEKIKGTAEPEISDYLFPPLEPIDKDKSYTVEELLYHMIVFSDVTATDILFDNIDNNILNGVFSDLGVPFKEDKTSRDYITLKLNSLFLRVLHNATYLNREYSEKALALIDQDKTDKSFGLGSDIPREIPFVDRLGGRKYIENRKKVYQIDDCGIAYYPNYPYLLCVSVTSYSEDNAQKFLQNMGRSVYDEVNYKYKK